MCWDSWGERLLKDRLAELSSFPQENGLFFFDSKIQLIPNEFIKVSESGISSVEAIKSLQPFGYKGFLIGENFMKTNNAGESAKQFIKQINL